MPPVSISEVRALAIDDDQGLEPQIVNTWYTKGPKRRSRRLRRNAKRRNEAIALQEELMRSDSEYDDEEEEETEHGIIYEEDTEVEDAVEPEDNAEPEEVVESEDDETDDSAVLSDNDESEDDSGSEEFFESEEFIESEDNTEFEEVESDDSVFEEEIVEVEDSSADESNAEPEDHAEVVSDDEVRAAPDVTLRDALDIHIVTEDVLLQLANAYQSDEELDGVISFFDMLELDDDSSEISQEDPEDVHLEKVYVEVEARLLYSAIRDGAKEVAQWLIGQQCTSSTQAFMAAIARNENDMLREMIAAERDVDPEFDINNTMAVFGPEEQTVDDEDEAVDTGYSLLDVAVRSHNFVAAGILLDEGIDPSLHRDAQLRMERESKRLTEEVANPPKTNPSEVRAEIMVQLRRLIEAARAPRTAPTELATLIDLARRIDLNIDHVPHRRSSVLSNLDIGLGIDAIEESPTPSPTLSDSPLFVPQSPPPAMLKTPPPSPSGPSPSLSGLLLPEHGAPSLGPPPATQFPSSAQPFALPFAPITPPVIQFPSSAQPVTSPFAQVTPSQSVWPASPPRPLHPAPPLHWLSRPPVPPERGVKVSFTMPGWTGPSTRPPPPEPLSPKSTDPPSGKRTRNDDDDGDGDDSNDNNSDQSQGQAKRRRSSGESSGKNSGKNSGESSEEGSEKSSGPEVASFMAQAAPYDFPGPIGEGSPSAILSCGTLPAPVSSTLWMPEIYMTPRMTLGPSKRPFTDESLNEDKNSAASKRVKLGREPPVRKGPLPSPNSLSESDFHGTYAGDTRSTYPVSYANSRIYDGDSDEEMSGDLRPYADPTRNPYEEVFWGRRISKQHDARLFV